jgi:hypothetical protein
MDREHFNHQHSDGSGDYLSGLDIDALLDHPYWEPMEDKLERLAYGVPETSQEYERTTILTWLYRGNGVLTFLDLSDRITAPLTVTERKKSARQVLRLMETVHLVSIVNFPDPEEAAEDFEGVIGRKSLVSLTWTGMVWLRRAWAARAKIMGATFDPSIHADFVQEEDDGKCTNPYWVENLIGADPEMAAMAKRAGIHRKLGIEGRGAPPTSKPAVSSIFDLARFSAS